MDPKNLNQLDPRLKAAYDRVMGTDLSTSNAPQAPNPNPQSPIVEPTQAPQFGTQNVPPAQEQAPQYSPPPLDSQPPTPAPPPVYLDTSSVPTPAPSVVPPVYQSFNSETGSQPQAPETATVHHSSRFSVSTPILVVLGIAFFIAYAVLWIMVFGIKLF